MPGVSKVSFQVTRRARHLKLLEEPPETGRQETPWSRSIEPKYESYFRQTLFKLGELSHL